MLRELEREEEEESAFQYFYFYRFKNVEGDLWGSSRTLGPAAASFTSQVLSGSQARRL